MYKPYTFQVITIQRETLEMMGVEHQYGVSCLNRISQDYPEDREIPSKMQQFMLGASLACR